MLDQVGDAIVEASVSLLGCSQVYSVPPQYTRQIWGSKGDSQGEVTVVVATAN